jgi:transposase-like protein
MPWKQENGVAEQRERFVKEAFSKEKAFGQLCQEYGISRKTGYKWLSRVQREGNGALGDRQRGPQEGSVQAIEASWKLRIVAQKKTSQLGSKKALCTFGAFAPRGTGSFAGHDRASFETKWISSC